MSFSSLWDCNAINPLSPPSQHSKLNNCPHPSALLPYIPFNWHIALTHCGTHHKQIQCTAQGMNTTNTEQADPLIHVPADKVHGGYTHWNVLHKPWTRGVGGWDKCINTVLELLQENWSEVNNKSSGSQSSGTVPKYNYPLTQRILKRWWWGFVDMDHPSISYCWPAYNYQRSPLPAHL